MPLRSEDDLLPFLTDVHYDPQNLGEPADQRLYDKKKFHDGGGKNFHWVCQKLHKLIESGKNIHRLLSVANKNDTNTQRR